LNDDRQATAPPIRVIIVDELPIFRDGLRFLLGTDTRLKVVGGADLGPAADALVRDLRADILLLGYVSSGISAVEMLKRLSASVVSVRTILLVKSIDTPEIVEALHFGARGVLVRDSAPELLFKSIDAVMRGRYWIGRECAAADALELVRRLDHTPEDIRRFGLTHRQLQIVRGIVNGETNRGIATRLGISENTVKRHILHVFNKVGCSSRVELALFAAYHGLVRDL
jgi:DNA-binding NarL/FixJ family response regulator